MNKVETISILLIAFLLSSCCPTTSQYPLSPPENAKYDSRLEGTWVNRDGKIGYLHIGKTEGNLTKAIAVSIKNSGELDYIVLEMFPTIDSDNSYLNIYSEGMSLGLPPNQAGFIFLKYEFAGPDHLTIYYLNENYFEKVIKDGKLEGDILFKKPRNHAKQKVGKEVTDRIFITDNPDNILAFLNSNSGEAFSSEKIELYRAGISRRQ